jgi:hypothetical protein
MMNWKGFDILMDKLRYYPGTSLWKLRRTMKTSAWIASVMAEI